MGERWPPFSRQYAYVGATITEVAEKFEREVREKRY
jgi:ketopantoate hydroxymethyltransferase